jgi:predicted nucleic acid-binding protein
MPNTVLVDTGFLVALFDAHDPLHEGAKYILSDVLRPERAHLVTVWPTVVETCFFLNSRGKSAFLEWIRRGALYLRHIETADLATLIEIVDRYAEHNIDLADACLVWLSGVEKCNRVLTTDRKDFDMLRTPTGRSFERIWVNP